MNVTKHESQLNELGGNIVKTLIYFDIFSYPLTINELHNYMQVPAISLPQIEEELGLLCNKNLVYKLQKFYALQNDENLVNKRLIGNKNAEKMLRKAYKKSKLIGSFPYVKSVCISGSLSKGYMDEKGDIDYFIITKPERLWIARTLLILYKKIFLLNSRKYFCVNYFIDSNNLEIPDKNIFTATEILTLIPTYNTELYHQFITQNKWAFDYLPNKTNIVNDQVNNKTNFLTKFIEKILDRNIGDKLDGFFMKITLKKWERKFSYLQKEEFEVALRTRKYVSKHHPQGFQVKVLNEITRRIDNFEQLHQVKLHD